MTATKKQRLIAIVAVEFLAVMLAVWWWFFALVQTQKFEVVHVQGEVSVAGQPATAGMEGKAPGLVLETGKGAIATIRLGDGSTTRILPNTRLTVTRARSNRDRTQFDSAFKLDAGEITSQVPKGDGRQRGVSLVTKAVDIGVRGTVFTVKQQADASLLMVTRGLVRADGRSGQGVDVARNFGTVIVEGKAPLAPVVLPDPPTPLQPQSDIRIDQPNMEFSWTLPEGVDNWELAIARDAAFTYQVKRLYGSGTGWSGKLLLPKDGRYYWRVAALDSNGLRGDWSEPRGLVYKYYYTNGRAALEDLDPDAALEYFRNSETGLFDELSLLKERAWKYLHKRDIDPAQMHFDVLSKLEPGDVQTRLGLAELDLRTGKYSSAMQRLESILDDERFGSAILEVAAMATLGLGDRPQAMQYIERALSIDPDSQSARILRDSMLDEQVNNLLQTPWGRGTRHAFGAGQSPFQVARR